MILNTSAVVESVGRGAICRVRAADGRTVLCKICGKMARGGRGRSISIVPGDRVKIRLSPPDFARGLILWRLDAKAAA